MKTVLIVDDEPSGRKVIRALIERYFNDLKVIGESSNIADAETFIKHTNPDIVLLDIKMPNGSGLDLLQKLPEVNFAAILITAHEEFALRALKLSAIDYILKPINKNELEIAIKKSLNFLKLRDAYHDNIKTALKNQHSANDDKIFVINKYKNEKVIFNKINFIKADSNYSKINTDTKQFVTSKTLKEIEELICDDTNYFIRIHKSYIVNLNKVERIVQNNGIYYVKLNSGELLEISKRRWVILKPLLSVLKNN